MNKEQFQKLKQLDRIEYLLARKELDYPTPSFITFLGAFFNIFLILGIYVLLEYMAFGTFKILSIYPFLMNILKITLLMVFIFDIVNYISIYNKRKKLDSFFIKEKK